MADGEEPVGATSRFPVARTPGPSTSPSDLASADRSEERGETPSDSAIDVASDPGTPYTVIVTLRDRATAGAPSQVLSRPASRNLWYCNLIEPNAWGAHEIRRTWWQALHAGR